MTDERFIELVEAGYTSRQIGAMMHRSHSSAQARARRLGVQFAKIKPPRCRICGETRADQFGAQKERCLACWRDYRAERVRRRRRQIIDALGGGCAACGYDRYLAALHVHHTDPSRKDPSARHLVYWEWPRVQRELEHCILLCANCHMGLHHGEHTVDAEPTSVGDNLWRIPHRFPVDSEMLRDPDPREGSGFVRLTADQVLEIRAFCARGMSQRTVGERFGVSQTHASRIVRGTRRRSVAG